MTQADEIWMRRALGLAEATVGLASPNPVVGCCLVSDGVLLGEGAHVYDRLDHAEIVALRQARERGIDVAGATAYVTLEPCSHYGRTGPCADALVAARIARCVVATADPNPQVRGRGIERLRAAQVEVTVGAMQPQARALNDGFAKFIQTGQPLVTLKAALSVDGRLAPPPHTRTRTAPHWLTGPLARAEAQAMRHRSDAILVGIGTVLADDPALTDRTGLPRRRPLLRVVLDAGLRTPLDSQFARTARHDALVLCAETASPGQAAALEQLGVEVIRVASETGSLKLDAVLNALGARSILSLLVEGGSAVNGAFLREGLVDNATLFYAETELGEAAIPFAEGLASPFRLQQEMQRVETSRIGPDVCVRGYLRDPWGGDSTLPPTGDSGPCARSRE